MDVGHREMAQCGVAGFGRATSDTLMSRKSPSNANESGALCDYAGRIAVAADAASVGSSKVELGCDADW